MSAHSLTSCPCPTLARAHQWQSVKGEQCVRNLSTVTKAGSTCAGQELVQQNAPRVHAAWLERMCGAKLDALRANLGAMAEVHERALDARDSTIQVSTAVSLYRPQPKSSVGGQAQA